jgi:hypothetical protein
MDKYINDTLALSNSLVIKLLDIGIQINKDLYVKYGISTPSDKRMWKYFLNLSGLPHETNSVVKIHVIEINEEHILTKELLETYTDTKAELLKFGQYYSELLLTYPNDEQFIKGTLLPVDIDIAIEAVDGTVLNYGSTYIEKQELSLLRGIETHTISYLARWHVREYTLTDELYLAGMLATLYASIPNYILNNRLEKVYTNEAHTFHVEHFFRSHLDIWEDLSVVNEKTIWWLYNNLRYLIKHVGKNHTLQSIVENIFSANGVGIGRLALSTEDPEIVYDLNNIGTSLYKRGETVVLSEGLNSQYILDDNSIQDTKTVITNQLANLSTLETDILKNRADTYSDIFRDDINRVDNITQQSKIFDINTIKLFSIYGIDLMQVLLENWMEQSYNGTYDRNQYFIDPSTKLQYTLTPKQGILYLLKVLLETIGEGDRPLHSFNCFYLLNNDVTRDELNTCLLSRTDMEFMIDKIMTHIPTKTNIVTPKEFTKYMDKVVTLYKSMWLLDSNTENLSHSADMRILSDRINKRIRIDISDNGTPTTIDQLLANEGIVLNISENYDKHETIAELIKLFTGVEIDSYEDITKYVEKFMNIFNKLTSYTTQILTSSEDVKHLNSMYSNANVNNLSEGYITVTDARLIPLEENITWIVADANDYEDRLDVIPIFNHVVMNNIDTKIRGHMSLYAQPVDLIGYESRPLVSVEILNNTIPYYSPSVKAEGNDYNGMESDALSYGTNMMIDLVEVEVI